MNLLFFGFKGCGKTSLGRYMSQLWKKPFFDTDELIEKLYAEQYHEILTCRCIALKIGESGFRFLEKKVIHKLQEIEEIKRGEALIALGGGAVLDSDNQRTLAALGQLIYIRVNKDILKQRLLKGPLPSFLDPRDPEGSFEKMYQERKTVYEKIEEDKWQIMHSVRSLESRLGENLMEKRSVS